MIICGDTLQLRTFHRACFRALSAYEREREKERDRKRGRERERESAYGHHMYNPENIQGRYRCDRQLRKVNDHMTLWRYSVGRACEDLCACLQLRTFRACFRALSAYEREREGDRKRKRERERERERQRDRASEKKKKQTAAKRNEGVRLYNYY